MDEPANFSLERRSGPPSHVGRRVSIFLVISASLGVLQSLLAIFLPQARLPVVPWFFPAVIAFSIGATLSIALLCFGRFLFRREPYAFWVGLAFWLSSMVGLFYLLTVQGFLPGVSAAPAYLFYLLYLVLLLPSFFFSTQGQTPPVGSRADMLRGIGWSSLICLLVLGGIVVLHHLLPPLSLYRRAMALSRFTPYIFFALYLIAITIHWRKFRGRQEPLVGYFFVFLTFSLWVFPGIIHSRQPYDIAWYSYYLIPAFGGVLFYLVLLLEYWDLYRESKRGEEFQRLLKELNQDITALDLDSLLKKLTEKVREVFKVDICDVRVREKEVWRVMGVSGIEPERLRSRSTGAARGRSRWIIENRKPLSIPDVTRGVGSPTSGESTREIGIRGYLGVPLLSREREVIGVLRALTYQPREFSQAEVDLLQQLTQGAAIAIENGSLLKELKEKTQESESANLKLTRLLEEQTTLGEMLTQINLLDMDEVLKRLADRARRLLKVDHMQVRLLSKDGILRTVALAGSGAERYRERLLESGRGRSALVMASQKPLAIKDISQDKDFGPGHLMREMGVKGYLGLPMISREQKSIGVVLATTLVEREFTPEEIALGQQLAAGAAIAIENATLYQETGRREKIQAVLKELSQDITSLDVSTLLKKLTLKVCEFFKADASDVRLLEGERWVIKASTGIDPAPYQRRRDAETPRGEYGSGWIAKNRKPLLIRDILAPEGVAAGETVKNLGFRGYLGVPLISRDLEVIGVLRALSYQPREFTQQEVDLVQQLASGAAIALDNSKLLDEVRQKSRALEEINRQLSEAYQAKSDFLNTMAHELRTPLNVIIGNTQLLEDGFYGDFGEKAKGGLETVSKNAHNLLNLINEILDLARLEAKRVPLHIEDVLVEEIIRDLESFFAPLIKEKGLSLKIELDGPAPGLRSDRDKIREVLQNLLANAIKYTDQGEVGLRVSSLRDGGPLGRGVSICVRDTGIGIKKKDLQSIFEPFSVVEGVNRRKYPGSGLGLSIVRRLVELLEGEIHVESEFGKGSAFTVILPLVHSNAPNS